MSTDGLGYRFQMTQREVSDLGAPGLEQLRLDHVLAAVEDPARRRILARMLADALGRRDVPEYRADDLAAECGDGETPRHLAELRYAGWIRQRVGDSTLMARLRFDDLRLRFPSLMSMLSVRAWGDEPGVANSVRRIESALLDVVYQAR